MISSNCSQLLHIRDLKSSELFLVDSGAKVSIVKPTATEKNAPAPGMNLVSVNGSPISTYGNQIMTLTFDDNITTFQWIFIIADVPHNILGIDFLRQYALVVDFANSSLNNSLSNTGCSRIYDPISKFYKKQASKDSTKTQIFSERL